MSEINCGKRIFQLNCMQIAILTKKRVYCNLKHLNSKKTVIDFSAITVQKPVESSSSLSDRILVHFVAFYLQKSKKKNI